MKKILALIILLVLVLLAFPVGSNLITGDVASANPNQCPPGQEKKEGCDWVQHRVTYACQWLPKKAVANPWTVIEEGTCPQPEKKEVIVNTAVSIPSPTCTPLPTTAVLPTKTPVTKPTAKEPVKKDVVTFPSPTPFSFLSSICDGCKESQRQANSQETMAAVMSTQLSVQLTSVQIIIELTKGP